MEILGTDPSEKLFLHELLFGAINRISYNITLDTGKIQHSNPIGFQH